jgi:GNAT superfamily N-acetyltransferase
MAPLGRPGDAVPGRASQYRRIRRDGMSDVFIRRAKDDDADAVAVLFDAYRRFYEQPADLDGARRFVQARLRAGDSVVFVAERTGQLLGFTQLYPSFSSASMNRVWILNDLFVAPEHRRGGVGQALVKAAEDFARDGGSKGLVLATQKTNTDAKKVYEARGWKTDELFDHYQSSVLLRRATPAAAGRQLGVKSARS